MTLVIAVTGPESIWLLADRRLSAAGQKPMDDGRKIMFLETTDGVAILGYAGLRATASGTEPSDWMSAVLRGRKLPLEQSLGVLAKAMEEQLPPHMIQFPVNRKLAHHVIVPAFLGKELRLYSIDLDIAPDRKSRQFRIVRHTANNPPTGVPRTPRLWIGGSGMLYFSKQDNKKFKKLMRSLLRLIRANDLAKLSPLAVADHLAKLNYDVSVTDNSVGPRCIVAWRYRKGGSVHNGGGGHRFYTNLERDAKHPSLPTIANGMDVAALGGVILKMLETRPASKIFGTDMDRDEMNAALARLPDEPDENLV